jgi:hypothetical protein
VTAARAAGAMLVAALCAGGCPHPPPAKPGPPLPCTIATTTGGDQPMKDRTFPAPYWFTLLLQKYTLSGEVERPARQCNGLPATLDTDGCPNEPGAARIAARPLAPRDLVVVALGDARRLVWVMADHLADGQAEGPVAIAEVEAQGVVVRAIGVLRAYPENVSLRLARVGGGTVLVADGEVCAKPGSCERATRIVPQVGDRFVPKPLVDEKGACLGGAFFPLRAAGATGGGSRGSKYDLRVSLTFSPEAIAIREQLAITGAEAAVADPTMASSFITRVQAERQLTLRDGDLIATAPSVLTRWLAKQGHK